MKNEKEMTREDEGWSERARGIPFEKRAFLATQSRKMKKPTITRAPRSVVPTAAMFLVFLLFHGHGDLENPKHAQYGQCRAKIIKKNLYKSLKNYTKA